MTEESYQVEFRRLDAIARFCLNGRYGGFIQAFADAWLKADAENKRLMWPVWVTLVEKYDLADEVEAVFQA